MVSKSLSREEFCNLHYSSNEKRDNFSKDLIHYWVKATEYYNNSFSDLTTEPKTKLSALESFKIMIACFGVEDSMLIINFTSRNRTGISRLISHSHNLSHPEGSYKILRPCMNEWYRQIDNPYTRDSLQDIINSYFFRSKITQKLKHVETKDICDIYLIVAKVQQVRRIRVGFFKNSQVLELIDKILDAAWFKFDNLKSNDGFKAIRNNSATRTENLDMLILMQYHLTNNRRLIPSGNNWETDHKNIFSFINKMDDLKSNYQDEPWTKVYYWWSLWVLRKNKKIRLQPVHEIEEKISEFRKSLNPDIGSYLENMYNKEGKNLESSEKKSGDILNCLDVLLEHQNNPSNRIETDKKDEKRLIIKSFLSMTIGSEAKNLTNFYCNTTTMKVVRLDFYRSSPKIRGFRKSIVRNETSSIIESVLKEIRFAKSALNIQESMNNYEGIVNISVIIAQLFMKIHSFLGDSRITNNNWINNWKKTYRSSIWTEDRSELENELSKEILGEMKIFLSEVDNFLSRAELSTDIDLETPKDDDDFFQSLIRSWILDIEYLGKNNKIKLHQVGEMFGEFTGLDKPKSQSLFLYSRKNKIKLELSKSKLNLAPVGESLTY